VIAEELTLKPFKVLDSETVSGSRTYADTYDATHITVDAVTDGFVYAAYQDLVASANIARSKVLP